MDHEGVQATALKIVLDLLHVYSFEAFNIVAGESEGKTNDNKESSQKEDNSSPQREDNSSPQREDNSSPQREDNSSPQREIKGSPRGEGVGSPQGEEKKDTMQRLLNILVRFLEGEVSMSCD